MTTTPNFDTILERLRERQTEESDLDTLCGNCQATLTAVDRHAGYCTQCKSSIESDDEDLADNEYDWYNANGLFDYDGDDFNGWELGYDD